MKKYFFIFLFFSLTSFSQEFIFPKIDFKNTTEKPNPYIELLSLEDKNSLILKTSFNSYWYGGTIFYFLVFQSNGNVSKYEYKYSDEKKLKIIKKRISKKKYKFYWEFLNSCSKENLFDIDYTQLNITSKPINDSRSESMIISDGLLQSFEITKLNEYSAFDTYCPESYIEKKYPGYEERQKLLTLITRFTFTYDNY